MRAETDRGAVLVGAALLDELLGHLLATAFIDDPKASNRMLEYPGACSTFAARADLAYCLGLIGPDVVRDLSCIRKLRNQFAHSPWGVTLADERIGTMCDELEIIAGMRRRGTKIAMSARGKFGFVVAVLASNITRMADIQKHAKRAPKLTPDRLLDPKSQNPLGY
jgi:DNA-binding MltR family transcriptional regulator